MSDDDLIRRGDVERLIRNNRAETPDDDWSIVTRRDIRALPTDPRAAAALRLAEAVAQSMLVHEQDRQPPCMCGVFRKTCDCQKVPDGCVPGCRGCAVDAALAAWRALAKPLPDLTFDADDPLTDAFVEPEAPTPESVVADGACPTCAGSGRVKWQDTMTRERLSKPCPRCAGGAK